MKKNLLIAVLLLIPFIGFSQTTKPIDGFLGIKFGSTRAQVIAAATAKGITIDKANSDKDDLAFRNVKLGSRKAGGLLVRFIDGKVFEADYLFQPEVDDKVLDLYNSLIDDITKVYGEGNKNAKYKTPYNADDDDGDKIVGIQSGDIDFYTIWIDQQRNTIKLDISTDLLVRLQYQDRQLTQQAISKQDQKDKSDF